MRVFHSTGCLVAILVLAPGCARQATEPVDAPPAPVAETRPDATAVRPAGKATDLVPFGVALDGVAKEQSWPQGWREQGWRERLADYEVRTFPVSWREEQVFPLAVGSETFALVVLTGEGLALPSEDVQLLILFDRQGVARDLLACWVSNRVTGGGARFHTVVGRVPEADGARAVVRLDGVSISGNFAHRVDHGGRMTQYRWPEPPPVGRPTKWDANGLCRVAVGVEGFKVLFPGEADR